MKKLLFLLLFIHSNIFSQNFPFDLRNDIILLNESDKQDFLLLNYFYTAVETPEIAEAYFRIKDNFEIYQIGNKDLAFENIMISKSKISTNTPFQNLVNYFNSEEGINSFLKDNNPSDVDINFIGSGLGQLYGYEYVYVINNFIFYDYNGIDKFYRFGITYLIKTNNAVYQINVNTIKQYSINDIIIRIKD